MNQMVDKRWVLLYNSSIQPRLANFLTIRQRLAQLALTGMRVEQLDTKDMSDEELSRWRAKANWAAIRIHHRIRQVFGSRHLGGLPYFGKQVPALLILSENESVPDDVYPHRRGTGPDVQIETGIEVSIAGLIASRKTEDEVPGR